MHDTALFILEDDFTDETILAALSALQAYHSSAVSKAIGWNKLYKTNEKMTMDVYLVCPRKEYQFLFETCLANVLMIVSSIKDVPIRDYTYVAKLSLAVAKKLGDTRPLAQSLGILIGAEAGTLPSVVNLATHLDIPETENIDLLLYQVDLPKENEPSLETIFYACPFSKPLEDRIRDVFRSRIVFGVSSFETYLACALGKPVIEFQKDPQLYKWSNKKYICLTTDDNDAYDRAVKLCLSQDAKSTPTDLGISPAQDASTT